MATTGNETPTITPAIAGRTMTATSLNTAKATVSPASQVSNSSGGFPVPFVVTATGTTSSTPLIRFSCDGVVADLPVTTTATVQTPAEDIASLVTALGGDAAVAKVVDYRTLSVSAGALTSLPDARGSAFGNAFTGSGTARPTLVTGGSGGIDFDGVNDFLYCTDTAGTGIGSVTGAAWIAVVGTLPEDLGSGGTPFPFVGAAGMHTASKQILDLFVQPDGGIDVGTDAGNHSIPPGFTADGSVHVMFVRVGMGPGKTRGVAVDGGAETTASSFQSALTPDSATLGAWAVTGGSPQWFAKFRLKAALFGASDPLVTSAAAWTSMRATIRTWAQAHHASA